LISDILPKTDISPRSNLPITNPKVEENKTQLKNRNLNDLFLALQSGSLSLVERMVI
jgi:hypothetical protein